MRFSDVYKVLTSILDAVLPRKQRTVAIDGYTEENLHVSPEEHEAGGKRILTLLSYRDRATEDLIRAVKYDGSTHAAQLLAGVLEEYLREEIAQLKMFSTKPIFLVPIPLHSSRERERGFNQIELILKNLSVEFRGGAACRAAPLLKRTRATPPQTKLSRSSRLKNVQGAFAVTTQEIKNTHLFVIDDVTTTGATLCEAAKTLEKSGASVSLLALARA